MFRVGNTIPVFPESTVFPNEFPRSLVWPISAQEMRSEYRHRIIPIWIAEKSSINGHPFAEEATSTPLEFLEKFCMSSTVVAIRTICVSTVASVERRSHALETARDVPSAVESGSGCEPFRP